MRLLQHIVNRRMLKLNKNIYWGPTKKNIEINKGLSKHTSIGFRIEDYGLAKLTVKSDIPKYK